jgi:hypothetical protein
MRTLLDPFSFLVVSLSGWMDQHQQHVIHYLMEENRVLREQIGNRRMRFSDDQRRQLAARAKAIGRRLLQEIATIVTPETLLAWHRKMIAQKYDGSTNRGPGRPRTAAEIAAPVKCGNSFDILLRCQSDSGTCREWDASILRENRATSCQVLEGLVHRILELLKQSLKSTGIESCFCASAVRRKSFKVDACHRHHWMLLCRDG